jgi:hypothetical protein
MIYSGRDSTPFYIFIQLPCDLFFFLVVLFLTGLPVPPYVPPYLESNTGRWHECSVCGEMSESKTAHEEHLNDFGHRKRPRL